MRLHYPLNSQGAEDAGKLPWIDGVPSAGAEGSYPGHAIVTDTEAEILSAIDAAGLVRSGSDLTQLIQAASRGIWLGQFGGTATALAATLPNNLVIPSLLAGVRVRGIAASNYPGGGGTLAIAGIGPNAASVMSCPIVGVDGATALASGAWTAGQFLTFDIDASGNARFGGSASAGGIASAQAAGSGFNTQSFVSTQRVSMSQQGANALVTPISGLQVVKKSSTSLLRVNGSFNVRSPYSPGSGNGPAYFNLVLGSLLVQQTTSNGYPGVPTITPVLAQFGTKASPLAKGTYALSIQFGRTDTAAWAASWLANSTDESGNPNAGLMQLFIDEVEPA